MLDGIKKLFKKDKEPKIINVADRTIEVSIEKAKRLIRDEELKLREHGVAKTVAITEMKDLAEEADECSNQCEICTGSGYLQKNLRLIYPCKNCNSTGKTYWVDRMLTASKTRDYEEQYYKGIRQNLHTLIHEIKAEAFKIGAVVSIQITQVEKRVADDEHESYFKHLNIFGGLDVDDNSR